MNKHTCVQTHRDLVFGYLKTPEKQRLPLIKFLRSHKLQKRTFYILEGEYKSETLVLTKREVAKHKEKVKETVLDAWDRIEGKEPKERKTKEASQAWLKSRGHEINEALIQSCKDGNAGSLKLFFQLTQQLIEKQEVIHKLDGSFIAREIIRARRELESQGMGQVPDEPRILPANLCLPSGQE